MEKDIKMTDLPGNSMKLDGGAMFGNAPRILWQKWIRPDENNLIDIGARSLLIESDRYKILFETGPGAYMSSEMKKRFQIVQNDHVLLKSLEKHGVEPLDITHVIISHLHFDHAGGMLEQWSKKNKELKLVFKNACYITGRLNFYRSCAPHLRDKASFIPGLDSLLSKSGQLDLKDDSDTLELGGVHIEFIESHGHTPGMILSHIKAGGIDIIFMGDLVPGTSWVNLPITMGYDRNAELLIDEKSRVLKRAFDNKALLFYTHDPVYAVSKLDFDMEKQRYIPVDLKKEFCVPEVLR